MRETANKATNGKDSAAKAFLPVCKHAWYVLEGDTKDDSWSPSSGPEKSNGPASNSKLGIRCFTHVQADACKLEHIECKSYANLRTVHSQSHGKVTIEVMQGCIKLKYIQTHFTVV